MLVGTDSDLSISWLIGTLVYEKLCEALGNKALVRGIKQASPHAQTSCLEGFHSVLNHFAPKMIAYSCWHVLQVQMVYGLFVLVWW